MKIQALRAFQMLTLLLMLGVTSAHALNMTSDKVVANIPFDFTVGKTTLPAGEYVVQRGSGLEPGGLVCSEQRDVRSGSRVRKRG